MRNTHNIQVILNVVFILTLLQIIADELTSFEIKSQMVKSVSYWGLLALIPLTLVSNIWSPVKRKQKVSGSVLPILTLAGILIIGPLEFVFSSSVWNTQEIYYQNAHFAAKKVEFQMQDLGAFGYNRRTVQVMYLTDLFMLVGSVEEDIESKVEWIRVNKEINELGIRFP